MWSDLRYAVRSLASRPLVTGVAVLSLALGIGVNSAIFSVFDRLLLRRLPVPAAGELVNITSPGPKPGSRETGDSGDSEAIFSYPLVRDIERVQTVFSSVGIQHDFNANLSYRGQTATGQGVLVSGGYFPTLGIVPALGRLFTLEDDRVPGAHDVVVLSHSYWVTRFGSSPTVLNDTLVVNGTPMTIVGVAPEGFQGTATIERPQVFAPLTMAERMRPEWKGLDARDSHWLYAFGRLKPGLSREQAQNLINVPFTALIRDVEFPILRGRIATERAREQFRARQIVLQDGSRGQFSMEGRGRVRIILVVLFAVTGFVLLIACANVGNLLLARASDRSKEVAVRLSMGASGARLIRLMLVEAGLLGLLGSVAALAVAQLTLQWLLTILPADDRSLLAFSLDTPVLLFTLLLGVTTGVVFGLFPAVHGVRSSLSAGLTAQSARSSSSRSAARFRTGLATAQIALATALLAQSGLFITSLVNLGRVDLGLQREGLITFRLSPYLNGYSQERSRAFFDRIEDELRGLPGVTDVTSSTHPLLGDGDSGESVTVEGFSAAPDADMSASFALISTDYFSTVGIPLLAGREFTRADAESTQKVVIVNEAFARKFNMGSRVVGRRIARGTGTDKVPDIEIVGLVRDAKYREVRDAPPPQFFLPHRQMSIGSLSFYARSTGDARSLLTAIPAVVSRADANLPVVNLRTMDEQIWNSVSSDRILATLSSSFAGLATLLAGIGLYAMLAYTVAQRVREIGIRIALGATPGNVGRLVFSHVGRITLVGGAVGVAIAIGFARLGQSLLFGLSSVEPLIIGGCTAIVIAVAFIAGTVPARRASRVDPVVALRAE